MLPLTVSNMQYGGATSAGLEHLATRRCLAEMLISESVCLQVERNAVIGDDEAARKKDIPIVQLNPGGAPLLASHSLLSFNPRRLAHVGHEAHLSCIRFYYFDRWWRLSSLAPLNVPKPFKLVQVPPANLIP